MRNHVKQLREAQQVVHAAASKQMDELAYQAGAKTANLVEELAKGNQQAAIYAGMGEYNPLPRLFAGIQFRNAQHKSQLAAAVIREISEQRDQVRNAERQRRNDLERRYDTEIERLRAALELEQARHRADIFNFASGRNPRYDVVGKAEDYRPALAV